jgi:hypothetical protein
MRRIARRLNRDTRQIKAIGQLASFHQSVDLADDHKVEMGKNVSHVVAYLSNKR